MSRVFVTGSTEGLGFATAQTLLAEGHKVVAHARNAARREALRPLLDQGAEVVVGDLADPAQTRAVAEQVNRLGAMDAIIHNAGVYRGPTVLPVNVLAPYALTALLDRPKRLIYLSSRMHRGGHARLDGVDWHGARDTDAYSDSKLFVAALAAAVARRWPMVASHAVDPGWVPTRMGGPQAPDDLRLGHRTQEWLATGADADIGLSGGYWFHQQRQTPHPAVTDADFQERLLAALAVATGIVLD